MSRRRLVVAAAALALFVAACNGDDDVTPTPTPEVPGPAMAPSALSADAQDSDGTSIVVASVTLPSPGFIAVHADADGPGAVIGHSDLLPAGESADVTVVLDAPLTGSATVWPMVHIDVDGDGVYDFAPPDVVDDLPGLTAGGDVAVIPVDINVPPMRSPSALSADAQDSDGTSIVVASVTLPSPGFIAVHADADGGPGAVIGHSDLLPTGTSINVAVTLDEALAGSATVWPMVHIDVDGDGVYDFAPPDVLDDLPGVTTGGEVAVIPVDINVLPPVAPSALSADAQDSDGTSIVIASVTLPSPGFIAVHADADGGPGAVIGHSDLLPAGESADVTVVLDDPLVGSATVWPMVHIDLDSDGVYDFAPPDVLDDLPGVTAGGDVAVIPVEINVPPARGPSALSADAQDSDGTSIVIASVTLPSPGFIAIHADADGGPGAVIGHSELLPAGESTNVVVMLDEPLTESAKLWPMVHIDLDSDGVYDFAPPDVLDDLPGLTAGGDVAVIPVDISVV